MMLKKMGVAKVGSVALRVLLALVFLVSAVQKLTGGLDVVRDHLDIAPWFWFVTALVELVGVLGLLASLKFPSLATPAGLWISAIMVGAIAARLRAGDPLPEMFLEAQLLALALVAAVLGVRPGRESQTRAVPSKKSRVSSVDYRKER